MNAGFRIAGLLRWCASQIAVYSSLHILAACRMLCNSSQVCNFDIFPCISGRGRFCFPLDPQLPDPDLTRTNRPLIESHLSTPSKFLCHRGRAASIFFPSSHPRLAVGAAR